MADPIKGSDVLIQFDVGDGYFDYACATDVSIEFDMETKSVKTVGDGVWRKKRGQLLGYVISLDGVIKFDDDQVPHAFDLLANLVNMVGIAFRMIFEETTTTLTKVIEGIVLPVRVNLSGPAEGFAGGSATLEGIGAPTITDSITNCEASIDSFTAVGDPDSPGRVNLNFTGISPDTVRIEYSIDGGGRQTIFSMSANFLYNINGVSAGSHTIVFYTVCENGIDGNSYTKNVTVT